MVTISILLMAITLRAYSPCYVTLPVMYAEKIQPFDPLLYSFQSVESSFDTDTVNRLGYTGVLQIGQEMTDEANRLCEMYGNPVRFTFPESALDSMQSVQIWYIVQDYWNPQYNMRKACRIWNPLASINYYNKIKKTHEKITKTYPRS